jgi:uncharacterized protein (TIGR03435 family)
MKLALLILTFSSFATAQSFDVAIVRPHDPAMPVTISTQTAGRFNATLTLRYMIQEAYNIAPYQLSGGPPWLDGELWDVTAKAEGYKAEIPIEKLRPMLRALLDEHFELSLRPEKKELPYFALVVVKSGPKLKPNTGDPFDFHREPGPSVSFTKVSMPAFATWLEPWVQAGRRIVDRTGLDGEYDFRLQWTPDFLRSAPLTTTFATGETLTTPPDSAGPSIFTALQEQLGLRLEAQKGVLEGFVVEHVARPKEN